MQTNLEEFSLSQINGILKPTTGIGWGGVKGGFTWHRVYGIWRWLIENWRRI